MFVCLQLIRRAMQPPGQYRFFLIPPKFPTKNQATKKKYLPNFRTQKNPGNENFKPKKSFDGATTECRATSDHLFYMCQNLFKNEA